MIISLVIWISYINEKNPNIKFSEVWRIVLFAQWSSVAAMFAKIFWFGFIQTNYTMDDLTSFYPLSILNFFDIKKLEVWFLYPIQLINVFELAYWIVLIVGIKKILHQKWLKSFEIVFLSYGLAMIVWIVAIMFISINLAN